jgi:hypothetical protein
MSGEIQLDFKELEARNIDCEGSNHNGVDDALT